MNLFRSRRRPASARPARNSDAEVGVGEFTQLALWMAATLAGLCTAALLTRRSFFEKLAERVGWLPNRDARGGGFPKPPTGTLALPLLADAIVGTSRQAIAEVFGPPRCAVATDPGHPQLTYWDADTWYYPMPDGDTLALCIRFDGTHAAAVRFLQTPPTP